MIKQMELSGIRRIEIIGYLEQKAERIQVDTMDTRNPLCEGNAGCEGWAKFDVGGVCVTVGPEELDKTGNAKLPVVQVRMSGEELLLAEVLKDFRMQFMTARG